MNIASHIKRTALFLFLSITLINFTIAQEGEVDTKTLELKVKKKVNDEKLSKEVLISVLNSEFRRITSGTSEDIIGNSASIDLGEAKVNFATNTVLKNNGIISFRFTGGSSEGIAPILTNQKLSPAFKVEALYNFPLYNDDSLGYKLDANKLVNYFDTLKEIHNQYSVDSLETLNIHNKALLDSIKNISKIKKLVAKKKRRQTELITLQRNSPNNSEQKKLLIRIDSFNYEINKLRLDSIKLAGKIREAQNAKYQAFEEARIRNKRAKALDKHQSKVPFVGYNLTWFSAGLSLENSTFKLYDASKVIADQLVNKNFFRPELKFQLSHYSYNSVSPKKSIFLSLGVGISVDHNLGDLNKFTIEDSRTIVIDSLSTREVTSPETTVYQGDYKNNIVNIRGYLDLYKFLNAERTLALHLYPEINLNDELISNFGLGLFMSFANEDVSKKTPVNAEIFYNLTDLSNAYESDIKLLGRSALGLRFTFPFNFNTNTKE